MTLNHDIINIISSFSSGIITKTSVAPLERIKILKQAQIKYQTNHYQGILQSIRFIIKNEGLKGLYYGNLTNIYRVTPSYILKFTLNDKFKSLFQTNNNKLTFEQLMISGICSGFLTTTICYPFDFIRTQFSLDTKMSIRHNNFINCGMYIIKNQGFLNLYKGSKIAFISMPGYIATQFSVYQYLKDSQYNTFTSSVIAGAISQTIFYPGDSIKRTMMLNNKDYNGLIDCVKKIYKRNGIKGIYAGYITNFVKMIPEVYIQFTTYEFLKNKLHTLNINQ